MIASLESRGPWTLETADDQGDRARGGSHVIAGGLSYTTADGLEWHTQRGGTCDRCGQAIVYVARLRNAAGDVARVGLDCATVLCAPRDVTRIERAIRARSKVRRETRRVTLAARVRARFSDIVVRCNALRDASDDGTFAAQFSRSLAGAIDAGRAPSDRQLACLARLEAERCAS